MSEQYINFWNQIKVIRQKLNDDTYQDEWKLNLQEKHHKALEERRCQHEVSNR